MANVKVRSWTYIEVDLHDGPVEYRVTTDAQVADALLSLLRSAVGKKKGAWYRADLQLSPMDKWKAAFSNELRAAEALGLTKAQAWRLIEDLTDKRWS